MDDRSLTNPAAEILFLRKENARLNKLVSLQEKQLAAANGEQSNGTSTTTLHQPEAAALETTNTKLSIPNHIWMKEIHPFIGTGSAWFITADPSSTNGLDFVYHRIPFSNEYIASLLRDGNISLLMQIYEIDNGILEMKFELLGFHARPRTYDRLYTEGEDNGDPISFAVYASFYGHLDILKWLHRIEKIDTNMGDESGSAIWQAAIRNGDSANWDVLKFLLNIRCPWDKYVPDVAAELGYVRVLEWLLQNDCPSDPPGLCETAALNQVEVVKWLWDNEYPFDEETFDCAVHCAAWDGNSEAVKYLYSNGCPRNEPSTFYSFAQSGDLDMMNWLHDQGCECSTSAFISAAAWGHLEVVEWLHTHSYPYDDRAFTFAAEWGHLDVVKYLYDNNFPRNEPAAFADAARRGCLEVLIWLHDQGCQCDTSAFISAADGGYLEVVEWLHTHSYQYNDQAFTCAAGRGHLDIVKYLYDNNIPRNEPAAFADAARWGRLEVLVWLHDHNCQLDEQACISASSGGHLEALQWLRANGCPWGEEVSAAAAGGGHLGVLKWLRANGCPWNHEMVLSGARHWDQESEMMGWLLDNGPP